MKYVELPLEDLPIYDFSISLEGVSYIVEMIYNERDGLYFMTLYTAEKERLVSGLAVVPSFPISVDYPLPNLSGYFLLRKKGVLLAEPYKEYPDRLKQYYDFLYVYN